MALKIGDKAPAFTLPDENDQPVSLADYKGKWLVLYFYPKDNTSGCSLEGMDFTASLGDFHKLGADVVGVSRDSVKSHRSFIEKKKLKIKLLSDPERKALEKYGAWQMKKLYGKESMGVVRSTFLIAPDGKIAHIWDKVKVKGHVEEVRERLKVLSA